jgi:hypothetical protein
MILKFKLIKIPPKKQMLQNGCTRGSFVNASINTRKVKFLLSRTRRLQETHGLIRTFAVKAGDRMESASDKCWGFEILNSTH